jgi:hypothetical protein
MASANSASRALRRLAPALRPAAAPSYAAKARAQRRKCAPRARRAMRSALARFATPPAHRSALELHRQPLDRRHPPASLCGPRRRPHAACAALATSPDACDVTALTRGRHPPLSRAQVNTSPFDDAWMMKVKLSNPAGACCSGQRDSPERRFAKAAPLTRVRSRPQT